MAKHDCGHELNPELAFCIYCPPATDEPQPEQSPASRDETASESEGSSAPTQRLAPQPQSVTCVASFCGRQFPQTLSKCPFCMSPAPGADAPLAVVDFPRGLSLDVNHEVIVGRESGDNKVDAALARYEYVSRRHLSIRPDRDDGVMVDDLGSGNGTTINGELLTGPQRLGWGTTTELELAGECVITISVREASHGR